MTQEVRVHTHAAGRVVAFGWQQKAPGEWSRYLIRQCRACSRLLITDLIWVNLDFDVCASCLCQELAPDPLDDDLVVCRKCGMRSESGSGLPEPQDIDVDFDDDDPDA